jgi:hypothetical protein
MRLVPICILGAMCVAMVGCGSMATYEAERREELLTIYPPGHTSRNDVRKKWGKNGSGEFPHYYAAARPADGWESFSKKYVQERVFLSQQRTGEAVASVERYYGVDGHHFLGLCYIWYYYNAADKLLDVEWQYASD